jgi:hypothetical protein
MSFETDFDSAFTILLGKAQGTLTLEPAPAPAPVTSSGGGTSTVPAPTSYTVPFFWPGGGAAPVPAAFDPLVVEVPDPGEIVWVHLYAGDVNGQPVAVTTAIDLQVTRWESFGGSSPVYGSGTVPRITADSSANVSLSGWFTHLEGGDALIAKMTSFSGTATWVAMNIKVRRDTTAQNRVGVLDDTGGQVLDAYGNPIIYRT